MQYTSKQQAAIDCIDSNLQIIACAGSGKTRVVTARVINILTKKRDITPENIIAFTFTEKAAAELKDRIAQQFRATFGSVEGLAGMYVGTIHGFCLDILQRYLAKYLRFDVLDDIKQRILIDRYFQQSGMGKLPLRRWQDTGLYLGILGVLRAEDFQVAVVQSEAKDTWEAFQAYQALLDKKSYLDYDNILLEAVRAIIKNKILRAQLQERIKYVTVDEYQDVNPIQERLVHELHKLGANICVVGDDDQNIYQWRGSDVSHIITFAERYPDVVQIALEANFRSSPAIVEAARQVVGNITTRLPKQMRSEGQHTFTRGDLLALAFSEPCAEAGWIAQKIESMVGLPYQEGDSRRGLAYSDFAILLRSVRRNGEAIISALQARGIPYIVRGIAGLFDTAEAQASQALFQFLLDDPATMDEVILARVWLDADLGLSQEDIQRGITMLQERRKIDLTQDRQHYNLQQLFIDFLEEIGLREERIPGGRGEVAFYNFGKFSQVIGDFDAIHFKSAPAEKFQGFVSFLKYQAAELYPEGGQDQGYVVPDAVQVMTVHQAKGMEYPVVFLPSLQRNRFPSRKQANYVWKFVPKSAFHNPERYNGDEEDERRLFYVALTRSEKYLFCSWSPIPGNQLYQKASSFFLELTNLSQVLTRDPVHLASGERLPPSPRRPQINIELSFSELKYFFECPYHFKLRYLYGFTPPFVEALGYGHSIHNVLADIHRQARQGHVIDKAEIAQLMDTHFHLPYASDALLQDMRGAAERAIERYVVRHRDTFHNIIHTEESIEMVLPGGVVVQGRIDLIKRTDLNETIIVDFKSTDRAQAEDVTRLQLQVYALGYQQRFGHSADLIEIHNLDDGGSTRELVDNTLLTETVATVSKAGQALRTNDLPRLDTWCNKCENCDFAGICRSRANGPIRTKKNSREQVPALVKEVSY